MKKSFRKSIVSLVVSSLFLGGVFGSNAIALSFSPDLIVESVTFSKTNPVVNEAITIRATIKNIGNLSAGSFMVLVVSDGGDKAGGNIVSLAAGASTVVNMNAYWSTPGTRDVNTIADFVDGWTPGGSIAESNENNNSLKKQITVIGSNPTQPITIQATGLTLKASPKTIKAGKAVNVKGQLKNASGKPVAGKKVKIKANGKTIKVVTTKSGGVFTFKHKPKKTTKYSASFAGDGSYKAASSKAVKVIVKKVKKKKKSKR